MQLNIFAKLSLSDIFYVSSVSRGNVVIITNVASKWSKTPVNYSQFSELHAKYSERGLRILAFPSNQFGNQVQACPSNLRRVGCFFKGKFCQFFSVLHNSMRDKQSLLKWFDMKELINTYFSTVMVNWTRGLSVHSTVIDIWCIIQNQSIFQYLSSVFIYVML